MSWLVTDDSVSFLDADSIELKKNIPVGIYKTEFNPFRGTLLSKSELKLSHGKIYGNSQKIADHIVESFKMCDPVKNLGVLLSGGRGLGKTLTTRLVIEQLCKFYPVIVISEYTKDLPDFLSHVKGCVILMDEFEKFMGGNVHSNDADDEQSKQESLLSVLDGNSGSAGNLYLLTVNNVSKLDENLKSRPGRIRYHYKFNSESAQVVRDYCKDNLVRQELTEDIVKLLGSSKYVSLDIITSFVDELNKFPTLSPMDVKDFFNIEVEDVKYRLNILVKIKDKAFKYSVKFRGYLSNDWASVAREDSEAIRKYEDALNAGFDDEENCIDLPRDICITLDEESIPSFIYGDVPLDTSEISIENTSGNVDLSEIEIIQATISDDSYKDFYKRYDPRV